MLGIFALEEVDIFSNETPTLINLQENVHVIHAVLDLVQTLEIAASIISQIPLRFATLPGSAPTLWACISKSTSACKLRGRELVETLASF